MTSRLSDLYTQSARFLLGSAIAFALLNGAAWGVEQLIADDPVSRRYGDERLAGVYPQRTGDDIEGLLQETWGQETIYQPFVQFREGMSAGHYVNVSAAGYRHSFEQGSWPPATETFNIFVFGGSTLFGYGVADDETVASAIQRQLTRVSEMPVRVYNFGRGGYYSSQERVLFEQLLIDGYVPDAAIFVDGLNDFYFSSPMHTARLERLMAYRAVRQVARFSRQLPALRLIHRWLEPQPDRVGTPGEAIDPAYDLPQELGRRTERYLTNVELIRAVAERFDIRTAFVVQPVPVHAMELTYHPFASWSFGGNSASHYGYPMLASAVEALEPPTADLVWAGDLQRGLEPAEVAGLYVDQVHYSASMSRRLGTFIADQLVSRHLLGDAVEPATVALAG